MKLRALQLRSMRSQHSEEQKTQKSRIGWRNARSAERHGDGTLSYRACFDVEGEGEGEGEGEPQRELANETEGNADAGDTCQ